jgi:LPXTG-motif cell wall-anchored protein
VAASALAVAVFVPAGTALAQGDPTAGKTVFTNTGCGTCHTFKAAGSVGTIGPNLDTTKPSYSKAVNVVTNGATSSAGAMPAFKGTLTTAQIEDVAAFVSGTGGSQTTTTAPAQTTPAQTTPAQTTPAQTTPAQTTPAQTTPAQTTPAQTTPAQPTPAPTTTTTAPLAPPSAGSGGGGTAPGGTLPSTGFDAMPFAALAAGLCALGLVLVFWRPRKRGARR